MSGPAPLSPSTSPAGDVSSTEALDAGTTPVFGMSGPEGPLLTHGPPGPIGATGPGVDPLQGLGDPWGHGQQQNPGLSFADRAVCHSECSCEWSYLWSATRVFGYKWTDCQWSSCATCSIQHGSCGLADDETADALDTEYDGLHGEVITGICAKNARLATANQ